MTKSSPAPVTVLFERTVKPGKEKAFEKWYTGLIRESQKYPGHISTQVISRGNQYTTLQQFDSEKHLNDWLKSETRAKQIAKLPALTTSAPEPITLDGLEPWFTLPDQPLKKHIPKWKMALLTFAVIWTLVMLLNVTVMPAIASWPFLLRTAAIPVIIVPLLTYAIMPWLTRRLRKWLHA